MPTDRPNQAQTQTQPQPPGVRPDPRLQYLAVDLGGTKALLGLFVTDDANGAAPSPVHERRLACADFAGFEALLAAYLEIARSESVLGKIGSVCVGLAGPVDGPRARLTNRPWELDAERIGAMLPGARVTLVNDFAAAAAGIEVLVAADLRVVQQAPSRPGAPRLVMGPGTGLGTAVLVPDANGWRVLAGEGGHAGFAPRDEREIGLWRHLASRHGRVAWEHVVSGPGIEAIYEFLCASAPPSGATGGSLQRASAARIAAAALQTSEVSGRDADGNDPASPPADPDVASAALDMFASAFGAFAGDAALLALPRGGVYLAGGIAPKVFDARRTRLFLEAFSAKGVQSGLMQAFPVRLVGEPRLGLLGAALLAKRAHPGVAPA